MQIRQITLKELFEAYELVQKLYPLSYEEFEDIVYAMGDRYMMFGVFEKEALLGLRVSI